MASTQLGLLKVFLHNREAQYRHLHTIRKHTFQPENISTTTTVHPFQDHTTTISPLQDHKTVQSTEDLRNMFTHSFDKIGSMPGEYSITLDPNIPPVQHGRCRVPTEQRKRLRRKQRRWHKILSYHRWNLHPGRVHLHTAVSLMRP